LKFPFIQLYIHEHCNDEKLSLCSLATFGLWTKFVGAMHLADRCGLISGTREELSRVGRCTVVEVSSAIDELSKTGAADVTENNGVVTLVNRRMRREWKKRQQTKLRVNKVRSNGHVTLDVTQQKPPRAPARSDYDSDSSGEGKEYEKREVRSNGLSPLGRRIASWFNRRETTKWSERELRKLREVEALKPSEEDIALLEKRYVSKEPYIRQDIETLLNNWNGEIDRAKAKTNGHAGRASVVIPPWRRLEVVTEKIKALTGEFNATRDEGARTSIREEIKILRAEKEDLESKSGATGK
jgi:hypothetical protein